MVARGLHEFFSSICLYWLMGRALGLFGWSARCRSMVSFSPINPTTIGRASICFSHLVFRWRNDSWFYWLNSLLPVYSLPFLLSQSSHFWTFPKCSDFSSTFGAGNIALSTGTPLFLRSSASLMVSGFLCCGSSR